MTPGTAAPTVARKSVSFHASLSCETRERADRLAALQGVSRSEAIARALVLLEIACSPSVRGGGR